MIRSAIITYEIVLISCDVAGIIAKWFAAGEDRCARQFIDRSVLSDHKYDKWKELMPEPTFIDIDADSSIVVAKFKSEPGRDAGLPAPPSFAGDGRQVTKNYEVQRLLR